MNSLFAFNISSTKPIVQSTVEEFLIMEDTSKENLNVMFLEDGSNILDDTFILNDENDEMLVDEDGGILTSEWTTTNLKKSYLPSNWRFKFTRLSS